MVSSDSMAGQQPEMPPVAVEEGQTPQSQPQEIVSPACKSQIFSWRMAGAALAFLMVIGWIFIIVMLILEEKWVLVLVAWLLLYSAAHFCYWYCKRHSILFVHRQIRLRVLAHMRNEAGDKAIDTPPTYDEVMKTEAPPPAYFTVVSETFKPTTPAVPPPSYCVVSSSSSSSCSSSSKGGDKRKKSCKQQAFSNDAMVVEYRESPPAYQSPRWNRPLAPRILPAVHEESRVPTETAVTATAAATAAFAALATVPQVSSDSAISQSQTSESAPEDPIRNPIVQHLRSTTIATLDVESPEEVTSEVMTPSCSHETRLQVTSDVTDSAKGEPRRHKLSFSRFT